MNYSNVDRDEMEYVDGGVTLSRWMVSAPIDAIALLTPVGVALAPLKYLGKQAAKALIKKYAPKLAGFVAWAARTALGVTINVSSSTVLNLCINNISCVTSVGGLVSLALDYATDGSVNNKIVF